MREYVDTSILTTSMMLIGLLIFFLGLAFYCERVLPKAKNNPRAGVEVVCKTCGGTGEKEQDVNLLMSKASYSIWLNGHSRNCEACKKFPDGDPCEVDRKKYKEIMDKYEDVGPKIDKAACPGCMGIGRYIQHDGYRFGRERE